MIKNVSTIILICFFSASVGAAKISAVENTAEFCYHIAKDNSLDLKIKHNVDIELPLSEIAKHTECEDKWNPQIDLYEIYEVDFPEEWNCTTLVPLWYVKTCEEVQDFFKNKKKSHLTKGVSHNCTTSEKQIDGRELEGRFILEITKHPKWSFKETHTYKFKKNFNVKISGQCSDKTFNSENDEE